jgi:hypothetical protein
MYTGTGNISGDVYQLYINDGLIVSNSNGSEGPNGWNLNNQYNEISDCQIANLIVYNRVLTPAEITQIYNATKSRFGIDGISGTYTSTNITINTNKGVRISGVISGIGQVTKIGLDSLLLTGTYSSTGKVNINEGAVKLGAANIINDSTDINFNGGVLSTNHDETIRKLFLSNSSALKLGATAHQISFVSIDTLLNRKQLTIYGWQQNYNDTTNADTKLGGTLGKIKFLNDTLLGYQLDQFKFNNPTDLQNYFAVQYRATKFLVPILNVYSGSGGSGGGAGSSNTTGFSNVFISSSTTTGGSWSGDGSVASPYTFSPTSDDANINITDITTYLNAVNNNNVKINTVNANGRQTGTIISNAPFATSNASTAVNNLYIYAKDNLVLYQNITLNNNASTNPVTRVDFKSDAQSRF